MKAAIVLAFLFAQGLVAQPYSAFAPRSTPPTIELPFRLPAGAGAPVRV